MLNLKKFKPNIYTGSEYKLNDIRLSLSENILGYSPKVIKAVSEELKYINLYPDAEYRDLKEAIAIINDVDYDSVYIGNGEDELILSLALLLNKDRPNIISFKNSFYGYGYAAHIAQKKFVEIPYCLTSADDICHAIDNQTSIVFVCDPYNPLGTILDSNYLTQIIEKAFSSGAYVVLDEAYIEFSDQNAVHQQLREQYPNVITLKTFSKAYGLAGLRCGYILAKPEICVEVSGIRYMLPYNVNRLAVAAALASIQDQDFVRDQIKRIIDIREWFISELKHIGVFCYPSQTNFVTIRISNSQKFTQLLYKDCHILTRDLFEMGYVDHVRISIGEKQHMKLVLSFLQKYYYSEN